MEKISQKYTLSIPTALYEELTMEAERQDRSIKEIVRQCLKFGLIAMKIDQDPQADLFIHEKVEIPNSGNPPKQDIKQTKIKIVW